MRNIFTIATCISVVFFLIKFAEIKFMETRNSDEEDAGADEVVQDRPFKSVFKDTAIVYMSVVGAYYGLEQIGPLFNIGEAAGMGKKCSPEVFTEDPGF